ncbi:unnamed protein product [Clonostachys rhizophaga]|uniref:Fe2OG dioxygenase domain-containing protein n=1 Tax=Clonostachys rhizophaga TaxID=160324 RepID=A0A9N9YS49_9HYPO|nr:unnamed protein product [Clonostachys rhizophaga]
MSRAALTNIARLRALYAPRALRPTVLSLVSHKATPNATRHLTVSSKRSLTTSSIKLATTSPVVQKKLDSFIPLIDFSKFLHGSETERKQIAAEILGGFQNAGFIYLQNHGIAPDAVRTAFATSARFFAEPDEDKLNLSWLSPESNRGYSARGREKLKRVGEGDGEDAAPPDMKESFEIGREGDPAFPNQWPREGTMVDGFKDTMLGFYGLCRQLHGNVMSAIAVGMGLDAQYFERFISSGDNTLRLLHYPGVDASVWKNANAVRAGAHSDYGSLTLLFQDGRGGLQVQSPSGDFVDATPVEEAIVVNAGDLLARWSNDTIKSTIHRVVEPPVKEADSYPPRYSIAYFCNPNHSSFIEALPGTFATEDSKKYKGIQTGEYLVQRLTATY